MSKTTEKVKSVKGMPDVLPEQVAAWQHIESTIRTLAAGYGYEEIRMPVLERTQLFKRSIGEVTDIVEKEMFTFADQNDESITLRPEGTAGCVRACIENSMLRNHQQQKLWYMGPMFRYERPQKGRYRQFNQLGVEALNIPTPDIDAEQLAMLARLWKTLGVDSLLTLEINSLGDIQSRQAYREKLVEYFNSNLEKLDEDSKKRLLTNPLRILDSKNPEMQNLIEKAPVLIDHLDSESATHFSDLQKHLTDLGINFKINPRLVRGLDYYNRTVYEWVSDKLGSQSAVCAGGRYDTLVEQLGGEPTPAVGFAIGLERVLLLLEASNNEYAFPPDAYLICLGDKAHSQSLPLAEKIRNEVVDLKLVTHIGEGTLKNLLKKADKSGAEVALIIGDDEIAADSIAIKYLRKETEQKVVKLNDLKQTLRGK